MRLELPPERQLPNPEWMVERILTERRATTASATSRSDVLAQRARGRHGRDHCCRDRLGGACADWTSSGRCPAGDQHRGTFCTLNRRESDRWPIEGQLRAHLRTHVGDARTQEASYGAADHPRSNPSQRARPPNRRAAPPNPRPAPPLLRPSLAQTSAEERSAEPPVTTTVPIGVRVQAPYLDLTASGTMTGGDVYAILVETCVRSLPPNASERPAAEPQFLDTLDERGNGDH